MNANTRLIDVLLKIFLYYTSRVTFLGILFAIGLLLGSLRVYFKAPTYAATMTAFSPVVENAMIPELFSPIVLAAESRDFPRLASILGITEQEAASIKSFTVASLPVATSIVNLDNEYEKNLFKVDISTTNLDLLPKIQEGLLTYLNNQSYIKEKIVLKGTYIDRITAALENELSYLDSNQNLRLGLLQQGKVDDYLAINVNGESKDEEVLALHQTLERYVMLEKQLVAAVPITRFSDTSIPDDRNWLTISAFGLILAALGIGITGLRGFIRWSKTAQATGM